MSDAFIDEIYISADVLPVTRDFYSDTIRKFDVNPDLGTTYEKRREVAASLLGLDNWFQFLAGWAEAKFGPRMEPEFAVFTEMRVGDAHVRHCDGYLLDGKTPNHTPHRTHTAMVYFNQYGEDFTGGELIVGDGRPETLLELNPQTMGLNIAASRGMLFKVKPTPGLVVAFTSSIPHAVPPVLSGRRFALSCWFQGAVR